VTASPSARSNAARRRSFSRALAALILLATGLAGAGPKGSPASAAAGPATATARPNVVLILSDDQRWDTIMPRYMPHVVRTLVPNGITYTNAFVPDPLCCPSRASTLTGNTSSRTGVWANSGPIGGFKAFIRNGDQNRTIATDFSAAGYRTGLVGKFLNGYPQGHWSYVPPGWDSWFATPTGKYYDYEAARNGHKSHLFGTAPRDYVGRVETNNAIRFVGGSDGKPFFLYLSFTGPHEPAKPDPRDVDRFGPEWPNGEPPSYEEADVSDKPAWVQRDAARWPKHRDYFVNLHAHMLDTTFSIDREVGRLWRALPENTYVLYASDNGELWGEHDRGGKVVPYNESIRVPLILAYKGTSSPIARGTTDDRIALNIDYLPTLEHLAGVPHHGGATEGRDLMTSARPSFEVSHVGQAVPTYCGLRSRNWLFVKYATGTQELYDEKADPFELTNLAHDPASATQLAEMRSHARELCTAGRHPEPWPFP
jgi:arylsulfatase A-like enzyme